MQSAGSIAPSGCRHTFRVESAADLSRGVVRADSAALRLPDIDLEAPPARGQYTSVEGLLVAIASDLSAAALEHQRVGQEDVAAKIEAVVGKLEDWREGRNFPFEIVVDDPAGNSWVEPAPGDAPGKLVRSEYVRSREQNVKLGLVAEGDETDDNSTENASGVGTEYHPQHMEPAMPEGPTTNNVDDEDIVENEVYQFHDSCPACMQPCTTNMKMVNIPHFQQVVIMSTVCDHCGCKLCLYLRPKNLTKLKDRSNEVKTGGAVPARGRRITLKVATREDLSRDVLKSATCAASSPELELSVEPGTLGGRFTTVEGLLTQVRDDLRATVFDADGAPSGPEGRAATETDTGDGMDEQDRKRWGAFFARMDGAIAGEVPFTLVLADPMAASYVQSLSEVGGELDPALTVEDYDRTALEEEELGLADMKVEGYEGDAG